MNNNINMGAMGAMGGPVQPAMGMMNNGAMPPQGMPRQPMVHDNASNRSLLNTYIYEYFLRYDMYDCARAILNSDENVKVQKAGRRDEHGNLLGNGVGDDPMDTDNKDELDAKRPEGLPAPNVPTVLPDSCFLFEWFCVFWDMFNAQKTPAGKAQNSMVGQYVNHTQNQSRNKQYQQQDMLRQMRPDFANNQMNMMRMQQNGGLNMMKPGNNLPRTAMANSQTNPQTMQLLQQKQGQMQRDPSAVDGMGQRPASPGGADNAPSPSKRPRLDGGPFNPNAPGMMPNGRPAQGMPGQQTYAQNLQQHHNAQLPNKGPMPNVSGPQAQGSPMLAQGPELNAFYNADNMAGPNGMRPGGPGGNQAAGASNHALQDYQMQLMLLEQQNKKRLMMARQEQDGMTVRGDGGPGGPGGPGAPPGPNGQPFQGTSPQGGRTGASPNPTEQMKRTHQQMSNGGMGSPLPDGVQSRGSPNPAVNFGGVPPDPNMAPNFFGKQDPNMIGAQMNGMRPPNSHPGQPFQGQLNPQQMMQRQQQAAQQGGPQMQWPQGGPNGNPMISQGPQGQQMQGTPQQRAMPPPSAPPAGNAANQRATASPQTGNAAPPTPQQGNKANPKKKPTKSEKSKAATQKKSNSNLNSGATPAAEGAADPEPPTPATPITPVNAASFAKNGQNPAAAAVPNGQPGGPAPAQPQVQPNQMDPTQAGAFGMDNTGVDFSNLDFANPLAGSDVLDGFDFDSFLHDGENDPNAFDFNSAAFGMESGGEIGAG